MVTTSPREIVLYEERGRGEVRLVCLTVVSLRNAVLLSFTVSSFLELLQLRQLRFIMCCSPRNCHIRWFFLAVIRWDDVGVRPGAGRYLAACNEFSNLSCRSIHDSSRAQDGRFHGTSSLSAHRCSLLCAHDSPSDAGEEGFACD